MFLAAVLAATYLGNAACKPCHTALYEKYSASPMARTSGAVSTTPGGKYKQVTIDNLGRTHWDNSERKLDYFIGSGAHGRSYLTIRDGFLFQAPFTWYSQKGQWDASPGFENDRFLRWSRPIEPNCLWCHASQSKPIYATVNRYASPPFAQDGVACERCHGPGSEHVRDDARMINPAKLEPARRDAICAQCHLSGEARIEKANKQLAMYRPGELLSDYVTYFVAAKGEMKATSHFEKLSASACKKASGDKLWCGTCHSPHQTVSVRDACLSCHAQNTCNRGHGCASCHMPKKQVVDGGHGVLTDHSIPRRPGSEKTASGWALRPWPGYEGADRELGLAYAEASVQTQNRQQRETAVTLLAATAPDAEVLLKLAYLVEQRGELQRASELYRRVLTLQPHSMLALVNLGGIEGRRGNYGQAVRLWRKALEINPGQPEAGRNLALLLRALGRTSEAANVETSFRQFGN